MLNRRGYTIKATGAELYILLHQSYDSCNNYTQGATQSHRVWHGLTSLREAPVKHAQKLWIQIVVGILIFCFENMLIFRLTHHRNIAIAFHSNCQNSHHWLKLKFFKTFVHAVNKKWLSELMVRPVYNPQRFLPRCLRHRRDPSFSVDCIGLFLHFWWYAVMDGVIYDS